jgi:predicted RNase H-like HicB family nuclease
MADKVKPTYTVVYENDDTGDWLVTVPDIPAAHTFGRTLPHAAEMARDVIALVLNVEPASFAIIDTFRLGRPTDELVQSARAARATADNAAGEAQRATAAALARLGGLSVRDAAYILGVSFQRVHQLRGPTAPQPSKSGRDGKSPPARTQQKTTRPTAPTASATKRRKAG